MASRTVIFPMFLTSEQKEALLKTIDLCAKAWTFCVDVACTMEKLSKKKLHNATYAIVRETLQLTSQYTCSSRDKAFEAVKSAKKLQTLGKKVTKPSVNKMQIRLDCNSLSFNKDRTIASIATQEGRIKVPLTWHKQAKRYESWNCKAGEIGFNNEDKLVLRLVFEKSFEMPPRTGIVYGVDRGIKHPMVVSNNKFYGEDWWAEHERKLLALITRLQSKGTKPAKRHLKKVWRRLVRFRKDCDRVIAKKVFKDFKPGDTVVLENLTNIKERCGKKGQVRKKHRAKVGRWSFKRQENALSYNAEVRGIYIEVVDARYTSQTCSRCNKVLKKNRKSQSLYSCSCGLKLNADLNAARNIAKKWCIANGYASGPTVNRPIVAAPTELVTSQ
jgi:putative transposase